MSRSVKLSRNKRRALEAILSSPSIASAAQACGLTRQTLHTYLKNPAFKAELRKRQDAILTATVASLVGLSGESLSTLQEIRSDPDAKDADRVRASLGWLQQLTRTLELLDLSERVEALEEVFDAKS